jgi:hypothetical protein
MIADDTQIHADLHMGLNNARLPEPQRRILPSTKDLHGLWSNLVNTFTKDVPMSLTTSIIFSQGQLHFSSWSLSKGGS